MNELPSCSQTSRDRLAGLQLGSGRAYGRGPRWGRCRACGDETRTGRQAATTSAWRNGARPRPTGAGMAVYTIRKPGNARRELFVGLPPFCLISTVAGFVLVIATRVFRDRGDGRLSPTFVWLLLPGVPAIMTLTA